MADAWLGISSAEFDSECGHTGAAACSTALDGTTYWFHELNEIHWFVLDLGQTYTIKKVRARSNFVYDPTYVNIYIDDSNPPTTLIEEQITTWQDTSEWVEVDITDSDGRYIKVEIKSTEHIANYLLFGIADAPPFTIFDVYGSAVAPPHVPRPTVAVGNPLMFQVLSTFRTPLYIRKPKLHHVA